MTWDQREAAALSAAIQRHRSASAGQASKRLYRLRNGAFSSTLAEITDFRVRNAGRRWLAIGIQQAQRDAARARHHRKAKEASACEARLADLHAFALALGPMEPETLRQAAQNPGRAGNPGNLPVGTAPALDGVGGFSGGRV